MTTSISEAEIFDNQNFDIGTSKMVYKKSATSKIKALKT